MEAEWPANSEGIAELDVDTLAIAPVAFAKDSVMAETFREALSRIGIHCIAGEHAGSDLIAFGKVPILVAENDYERASEILAGIDLEADDWDDEDKEEIEEFEDDEDDEDCFLADDGDEFEDDPEEDGDFDE